MFGLHGVSARQHVKAFKQESHFLAKFQNKFDHVENHVQNCQTGLLGPNVRRDVEWENGNGEDFVSNRTSYQMIVKRAMTNGSIAKHVMSVHVLM